MELPTVEAPPPVQPQKKEGISQDTKNLIFRITFILSILLWRYGAFKHWLIVTLICAWADSDRNALHLYNEFMKWPHYDIRDYTPPNTLITKIFSAPLHYLFPMKCEGLENIPQNGRFLLVGNHQNMIMDSSSFVTSLYFWTGFWIRPMTDRSHYKIPFVKHYLQSVGCFEANPENCAKMMEAGKPLLVYPGGSAEVFKDERIPPYTLVWKDNAGFAKLAAKHGYTIIPFASVGFEDCMKIWFSIPAYYLFSLLGDKRGKSEYEKYMASSSSSSFSSVTSPIGSPVASPSTMTDPAFKAFSKGYVPPPVADTRIPIYAPWTLRPQANYVVFGKPIDASAYSPVDKESVFELRDVTRSAVLQCIERGKELQAADPDRFTDVLGGILGEKRGAAGKKVKEE
ncbi:hypothetical protein HDU79_000555 [Rhizoclosmatium sp. JEL0117]|nr:hypothetical protein HDU79_000555 [Rhizoclosmatium sp. JEL0117]